MRATRWLLAALAALACGCPGVPPHTVDVPPRLVDVRPPRSVAFVRADVPLSGLRDAIEHAIPPTVTGRTHTKIPPLGDVELRWDLTRRPVTLRADPEGLVLEAALLGPVEVVAGDKRCETDAGGVAFRVTTRPTLRPDGALALEHLAWKPEPRGTLSCGLVPVPIGPLLDLVTAPLARALAGGLEKIEIPLGPAIRAALDELRAPRPIPLDFWKEGACLDLDPRALVLSPIGGEGEAVKLRIGVDVAPRLSLGRCPPGDRTAKPAADEVLVRAVPLRDSFEIAVAAAVPYADLRAATAPRLVGRRFGEGDRALVIDDLSLGDASGRVLARLAVHGAMNGDLYAWGTPEVVDRKGQLLLQVPDLTVAMESRSAVERVGVWLWQLTGGNLEGKLREAIERDVTAPIEGARAALSGRRALGGGLALNVMVDHVRPGPAISQPGAVVVDVALVGQAEIEPGGP